MKVAHRFFCLAAALLVAGCSAPRKAASSPAIRVMTYNIHHGAGTDGGIDLLRIAQVIQEEGADIVALEEVDKGVRRTQERDFPEELAGLTGMTCIFSNNFTHQGGEYGNAILTKFPVLHWSNHHFKMIRAGEQRGVLEVLLEVHGRRLVFMNTHIDFRRDDAERLMNVAELKEAAASFRGIPVILCGDFNDIPRSPVHLAMKQQFRDAWETAGNGNGFSYPTDKPEKRIDYIWTFKAEKLRLLKAWIGESSASDHLPLIADIQIE